MIDPYDINKVSERVALQQRKIGRNVYTEYTALKNLPAISQMLTNIAPNFNENKRSEILKGIVANSILKNLTHTYSNKQITPSTIMDAFEIVNNKHKKTSWIENRRPPFTDEEIETVPGEKLDGNLKKNLGYCLFLQVKNKEFKRMAEKED